MATERAQLVIEYETKGIDQSNRKLKGTETQARKTETATDRLGSSADKTGKSVSTLGVRAQKASQLMGSIGKKMSMFVTAPIVGLGIAAVKTAGDFESSMNRVSAVSGATEEQMEALTSQARELGATTQFSAQEAAEGMGFLAMAGFEVDEILDSMSDTLNLAAAAQMELGDAADIVSNIMKGFGLEADDLANATDVLTKTFTSSNTNLHQLGEGMSYVAPVAKGLGFSIEETAASIGVLSDAGIQGSRAGTGLRMIFAKLVEKSDQLGISIRDASGEMLPFADIIEQLEERGLSAEEAMEHFGERAGPAMQVIMENGSESLREFTGELKNAQGVTDEIAKKQMEGFNGKMKEFKSVAKDGAIILGNVIIPKLTEFVEKIKSGIEWFTGLNEGTQKTIVFFAGLVAAVGPVLIGLGAITEAIIVLNSAALFGPIGIIVGIGAVIVGFAKLKKHLDSKHVERLKDEYSKLAEEISGTEEVTEDFLKRMEGVELALSRNFHANFESANDQVTQLAKNTGLTKLQIIDVGLASNDVTDTMKEQLGVLKEQEEQNEAMRAYRLGQIEASKVTLEIMKKRAEEEKKVTKEMEKQLTIKDEMSTILDWEAEKTKEAVGWNDRLVDLGRASANLKSKEGRTIEQYNKNLKSILGYAEEELGLNKSKENIMNNIEKVQDMIGAQSRIVANADKDSKEDASKRLGFLEEALRVLQEMASTTSFEKEIIEDPDIMKEANQEMMEQVAMIERQAEVQSALGNEFDKSKAKSQAFDSIVKELIEDYGVSAEAIRDMAEKWGMLNEEVEKSLSFKEKLAGFFVDTFKAGKEEAKDFVAALEDVAMQLGEIAKRGYVDAFKEMGAAFAEGNNAASAFGDAVGKMLWELMRALPMMFLNAGLQAMISKMWPLGLALIAMSGMTAIAVGATEARVEGLQENAKGNVYDSGNIIPFAAGGVINKPTVFPFAGGTGLMGEDGPEAILPLHRDSSGELGVKSGGGGGEVNITIINNSGEEVRQEEKENQFGGKDIEIMIGNIQKKKLSDGSMDHVMKNRYGLKPRGKAV